MTEKVVHEIPDKLGAAKELPADQESDHPRSLQAWEKPGFKGASLRFWRAFQRYAWDDPDKPKEEKWFLFKLDMFLLTSASLGYFSKNLDASNVNNAYVSGMKEALNMHGSELTYAYNCYTAGYVVGQIPAVILSTRIRPSILLPTLEVLWSIATFCCAAIHTSPQLYALRFLIGLFESAYFPIMIYLVASWYTKEERGKRTVIFYSTGAMAMMFSGYLQAGVYRNLDGKRGLEGWQWLFIVCGIISLPIAFIGYVMYPDFPETTRAFFLTEKERQFARDRLVREGLQPLGAAKWDRTKLFRIAKQWQFWLLPVGYWIVQASTPIYQPAFPIWLRSTGHSVYQANVWPTGQIAIGLVVQLLAGAISDSPLLGGRRWPVLIAMQVPTIIGCLLIVIWNISDSSKLFAYYISWACVGTPGIYYAWYPDLIPHDHEMRGFVVAVSNTFSHIQSIWFTLTVWRTVDAPKFHKAFVAAMTLGFVLIGYVFLLRGLELRDRRIRQRAQDGVIDEESPNSPNDESDVSVEPSRNVKVAETKA
ncbi:hypothetical protein B0A52_07538 [Exophiala mesophila]|uniref:Major facilitator superfamily (MFS) profile domain-containing protein n=1 Tax=Exophiala mesophila TaxID=212818 RepID=A0A438MYR4_EXOME|nr:hypothetical protein B0A52_07538 [Exophiala mesophila]